MKNQQQKYTVTKQTKLLEFLFETLVGRSRTTVRATLKHGQVAINGKPTTKFDYPLYEGDMVTISPTGGIKNLRMQLPMLRIVHEDKWVIVIDKQSGLLSMATEKENTKTAYHILSQYVKREDPRNMIFIVHRLDRETSGLMLFAKSEEVKLTMQKGWKDLVTDRRYVAVTEGRMPQTEGVVEAPLAENKNHKVFVVDRPNPNLEVVDAKTDYKVLQARGAYSLVELTLETGRKNQIRAHLEWIGSPICGDKKYGATTNEAKRVCLHASKLAFTHPVTGDAMEFESELPKVFLTLTK